MHCQCENYFDLQTVYHVGNMVRYLYWIIAENYREKARIVFQRLKNYIKSEQRINWYR